MIHPLETHDLTAATWCHYPFSALSHGYVSWTKMAACVVNLLKILTSNALKHLHKWQETPEMWSCDWMVYVCVLYFVSSEFWNWTLTDWSSPSNPCKTKVLCNSWHSDPYITGNFSENLVAVTLSVLVVFPKKPWKKTLEYDGFHDSFLNNGSSSKLGFEWVNL